MNISIIIPTRNAEKYMDNLISKLSNQTIKPHEIIVIDSFSEDKTKEICSEYKNVKVIGINKGEFDHGGTRNRAAKEASGDILVFMTQDAYPENEDFIEELIKLLGKDGIAGSYGRQKARTNASELEKFARNFNYRDEDIVKSKEDIEKLGIKTFFLTNVCSAFIKDEFWNVGGFPEKTILNEDMIISSKLILSGKKIHYASKAVVIHSHDYTYINQFKRNFDIAVSLRADDNILEYASSESEGVKYVKEAGKYLIKIKKPYLIPHLIADSAFRFIGYKAGLKYDKLPKKLVKKMSMHSFYFDKDELGR
jgi:rhamnosyltransferase